MAIRRTKDGLYVLRTTTKGRVPSGHIRVQLSREPRAQLSKPWWEMMTIKQYQDLKPELVSRKTTPL